MMAGFMSYFGGRADPKQSARDAIVTLRQQVQMIEKKQENTQRKIDEEIRKAKATIMTNKAASTAALRRKKLFEAELVRLEGTQFQLETQMTTLESANLNAETMAAMKKATAALQTIHGKLDIDKVDQIMSEMTAQKEIADEVATAISNPVYGNADIDEDELLAELEGMQQDQLNETLMGADHVPAHMPAVPSHTEPSRHQAVEEDEEEELRRLQAELAM